MLFHVCRFSGFRGAIRSVSNCWIFAPESVSTQISQEKQAQSVQTILQRNDPDRRVNPKPSPTAVLYCRQPKQSVTVIISYIAFETRINRIHYTTADYFNAIYFSQTDSGFLENRSLTAFTAIGYITYPQTDLSARILLRNPANRFIHIDRQDFAIGIESHRADAGFAFVAGTVGDGKPVINDVVFILTRYLYH